MTRHEALSERMEARGLAGRLARPAAGALPVFSLTLGLSAFLLFVVQPMFAKMALPLLGGAPNVWNTAMVFFQAMLLLGYLYAHLLTRHLGPRAQVGVHLLVLALAALALPILPAEGWAEPPDGAQALWLIGLFAVSLGLPFFAVAANAPLMQHWFAQSRSRYSSDPYFLYAASNVGSVGALLCYPLLVEPFFALRAQSGLWSAGFIALVATIAACGAFVLAARADEGVAAPARAAEPAQAIGWRVKLRWLLLSFVPSSLLLGVTTYATTDVTAAPLLWVVPLALYLLTFVLAFARRERIGHQWLLKRQPLVIAAAALLLTQAQSAWVVALAAQLLAFFVTALICHGELARLRPAASELTRFYLFVSLGGVLGGAFTALAAPFLFDSAVEYPLMLVAACLLRPGLGGPRQALLKDVLMPLALALPLAVAVLGLKITMADLPPLALAPALALPCALVLASEGRPLRLSLASGVLFALLTGGAASGTLVHAKRNFFGVTRVFDSSDGALRRLAHGTTVHGVQLKDPARRLVAAGYYSADGPFGQAFAALRARPGGLRSVAVVGLGAGALACLGRADERWAFYEIDPDMARLARDRRYFTFLAECPPRPEIVIGDARLTLRKAAPRTIDFLILDAFTSDSVPAHLLTREAVALYRRLLTPDGVMLFHVSNRHLDLASVVAAVARDAGLSAAVQRFRPARERIMRGEAFNSDVVLVAREDVLAGLVGGNPAWQSAVPHPLVHAWRDDYSNVVAALLARMLSKDKPAL